MLNVHLLSSAHNKGETPFLSASIELHALRKAAVA